MPCALYLLGDSGPLMLNDDADVVLSTIARVIDDATGTPLVFCRAEQLAYSHDEPRRPAYFNVANVSAVVPLHPLEVEELLDHPPDWLE